MGMEQGIGPLTPDKFTEQAQQVLAASQGYVREFRHNQWDVEHIALALVEQKGGLMERILQELGVDGDRLRSALRRSLESLPKAPGRRPSVFATSSSARSTC
jgi:ATP-dependent Clp protease ATP-binding subunit ClpA